MQVGNVHLTILASNPKLKKHAKTTKSVYVHIRHIQHTHEYELDIIIITIIIILIIITIIIIMIVIIISVTMIIKFYGIYWTGYTAYVHIRYIQHTHMYIYGIDVSGS